MTSSKLGKGLLLVRNWVIKQHRYTQHEPQRKEEKRELALHCAAKDFYLQQAINNQTKKQNPAVVSAPFTPVNSIFYLY